MDTDQATHAARVNSLFNVFVDSAEADRIRRFWFGELVLRARTAQYRVTSATNYTMPGDHTAPEVHVLGASISLYRVRGGLS